VPALPALLAAASAEAAGTGIGPLVAGGVVAFAAAAWFTRLLIRWTTAAGVLDIPNSRSSHSRATPRGGGLAILVVVFAAGGVAAAADPGCRLRLAGVMLPALAVAAVSWLDDIRTLKNRTRFSVHLLAAAAAVWLLGPVERVSLGSLCTIDLEAAGLAAAAWPLSIVWIVGLTNAFNFMDGTDGIAGITAAACGAGLAAAGVAIGSPLVAILATAIAAGSLGFLTCNWQPARIFMGDVGSAFLGCVLAALPMAAGDSDAVALAVPVAVAGCWPFIFDTAYTLLRRLRKRENIFEAHRSHLYQRLVIAGWSHRGVAVLYGLLASSTAAMAVVPLFDPASRPTADVAAVVTVLGGAVLLVAATLVAERRHARLAAMGLAGDSKRQMA